MEKWKFVYENGVYVACYWGNSQSDIIMKVWVEHTYIRIKNDTECDDIGIPQEVIKELFAEKNI